MYELQSTGERLLPQELGNVALEHLHRYAFASELIYDFDVLDIASGEGYGSYLLSRRARSVIGVDICQSAVMHANKKYGNCKFLVGSCTAIPLENSSVDVVTSFETLEHIEEHEIFFEEIKRVLRPQGFLILSTPEKINYTVIQNHYNYFHKRELTKGEFIGLLSSKFKNFNLYDQTIFAGSAIVSSKTVDINGFRNYLGNFEKLTHSDNLINAPYMIAVAGNGSLPINKSISLFKGWDIPTEWEKVLSETFASHAAERLKWTESMEELKILYSKKFEQIVLERISTDSLMKLEIDRLRAKSEEVKFLNAELARIIAEHSAEIEAKDEEIRALRKIGGGLTDNLTIEL